MKYISKYRVYDQEKFIQVSWKDVHQLLIQVFPIGFTPAVGGGGGVS